MCVLPACKRIYAKKSFHILTSEETIQYVIDNKCSVARFGDGELGMMFTGRTTGFQESHEELKKGLA